MNSRAFPFKLPAGLSKSLIVPIGGTKIFVRQATGAFDIQLPAENTRLFAERGARFNSPIPFRQLQIWNRSDELEVNGLLIVGDDDVEFSDTQVPSTRSVGWNVNLAQDAEMEFPGFATDDANYALHGVPVGARRKTFIVTLKGSLTAASGLSGISIKNSDTGIITNIFAAPGIAKETDDNLTIKNLFGATLDNSHNVNGNPPDIAIEEIFYL